MHNAVKYGGIYENYAELRWSVWTKKKVGGGASDLKIILANIKMVFPIRKWTYRIPYQQR